MTAIAAKLTNKTVLTGLARLVIWVKSVVSFFMPFEFSCPKGETDTTKSRITPKVPVIKRLGLGEETEYRG
jgi:hypothetical protein